MPPPPPTHSYFFPPMNVTRTQTKRRIISRRDKVITSASPERLALIWEYYAINSPQNNCNMRSSGTENWIFAGVRWRLKGAMRMKVIAHPRGFSSCRYLKQLCTLERELHFGKRNLILLKFKTIEKETFKSS